MLVKAKHKVPNEAKRNKGGEAGEICARARPTGAAARASSRLCQHRKNAEQHMPSGLRAVGSCTRIALSVLTQSFAPFSSAARKR